MYPLGLSKYVHRINSLNRFDACIVNYYWLSRVLENLDVKIKAINTHDVFAFKDMAVGSPNTWMCTYPNEEAKALQRTDIAFALQNEEAAYFTKVAPSTAISKVYCPYSIHKQEIANNHNLVLLSGANVFNIEGFEWFVDKILPLLIKRFPDIQVVVGGYICKKLQIKKYSEHIKLIGSVEDPADLYKLGDVAINPCYKGTGLKIKTFEALSYGKICMTHPHSKIGIYKKDLAPVFSSNVAEEWESFLAEVWGNENRIKDLQEESINYIAEMNNFISSEYKKYFSEYENSLHDHKI